MKEVLGKPENAVKNDMRDKQDHKSESTILEIDSIIPVAVSLFNVYGDFLYV